MPVHHVPRASLHEDIKAIERGGERILSITPDGDRFVIVTRPQGDGDIETRPAEPSAEEQHAAAVAALRAELVGGGSIDDSIANRWADVAPEEAES